MTLDQSKTGKGPDLRLVAGVFLLAAAILIFRALSARSGAPFFADTDDAMRMVVVRDFLGGQGWYDLTAHRLNTPWGAEIHWSRLIDLPLAGLLWLAQLVLPSDQAMLAVGYVWPMLLLAILLWLSAALANRLVGPQGVLPALVLPALSPAITAEFTPGRVDHHNVAIILSLALVWTAIEAIRRPRMAIWSGVLAATCLAIAIETLPVVAVSILVAGLVFVLDQREAPAMRNFGLAFAGATLLHLAIYRPPSRWLEAACDVLSPVYGLMALGVAAAFLIAAALPAPRRPWQRFVLLAILGGVALAMVALVYPQCLKGPYGQMDPWLQQRWLSAIVEAKPWFESLFDLPAYSLAVGLPVLLGVGVIAYRIWREPADRLEWFALLVFLTGLALVMLAQVRGARLAIMPSMPAAAWLIVALRQRYLAHPRLGPALALVGSWLAFSGVVLAVLVTLLVNAMPGRAREVAEIRASKDSCLVPAAFTDLAGMVPERILAPIDLGAHLLLNTPHAVVAAPYHRNEQGVRDTFRFFNEPIATAEAIARERGLGLVVLCPPMPELRGFADRAEDSFISLWQQGNLPAWLARVSPPDAPLEIYAVLPPPAPPAPAPPAPSS